MPARDYQNAAVLWFIEEKYNDLKAAKKIIEQSGAKLGPLFWTFKAPQGGTFKIIDKKPSNREYGLTLQREDGSESLCVIHHGYDSESIIGVKMDKFK